MSISVGSRGDPELRSPSGAAPCLHRDQLAEKPQADEAWPETQALLETPSLKTSDLPEPSLQPQGAATDSPGALGLSSLTQGGCHPPAPATTKGQGLPGAPSSQLPSQPPQDTAPADPEPEAICPAARAQATMDSPRGPVVRSCPPGGEAPCLPRTACPSLQEATRLIQEEFACDGYLDNGLEALIMGAAGGPGWGAWAGYEHRPLHLRPHTRRVHLRPEGPHLRHLLWGCV